MRANMAWLGVNNGTAAFAGGTAYTWEEATALFIKNYTTEVMHAFDKKCIFKDLHKIRTINHGKSAEFYFTGTSKARYHEKGTPVLGSNNPPISATTINVDSELIADCMIYDLEDAMLHIDVRQEFSRQNGIALANSFDERIARLFYLAARHDPMNKDHPGGSKLYKPDADTDGAVLAQLIRDAAQTLDEKDVNDSDRFIVVKPAQYYLLASVKDLINRDYGGNGSIKDVELQSIANMTLKKSMNLPNGTKVTQKLEGEHNDYTGDFTNSVAVVGNRDAVGTVKLRDLKVQQTTGDINILYRGSLFVSSYIMGHGILDPRGAIEIAKA